MTVFQISVRMMNFKTEEVVEKLENPIHFRTKITHETSQYVKHAFCMGLTDTIRKTNILDDQIPVLQLSPEMEIKYVLLEFKDLKPFDKIKVVVMENMRPVIGDFDHAFEISTKKPYYQHRLNLKLKDFGYIGFLPDPDTFLISAEPYGEQKCYNISVRISRISCDIWNRKHYIWESHHCYVDSNTTTTEVVCACLHSSLFMTSTKNVQSAVVVDWVIPFLFRKEVNFVVLFAFLIVCVLFAIAYYIAYLRQKRLARKKRVLYLYDNNMNCERRYLICVYTGTGSYSGTTANVGFKLYGNLAESERHIFRGYYEPVLQRSNEDWFYLLTYDLGEIYKLDLWTDCHGISKSWYCKRVLVYSIDQERIWVFEIHDWLSVLNHNTHNRYLVQTKIPKKTIYQFARTGLLRHLWPSPYKRIGTQQFSWADRLTLMFIIVLLCMLFSILVLGVPSPKMYGQFGRGHFEYGMYEFGLSALVGFVVFMISAVIIFLFKTKRTLPVLELVKRNGSYGIFLRFLIYPLLITIAVLLNYFGIWFSFISSLIWIPLFIVSIFFCIFFEIIRVVLTAIILRQLKPTYISRLDLASVHYQQEKVFRHFKEKGMRPFFKKYYMPISRVDKKLKRDKELTRVKLRNTIADVGMYAIYMIVLFCVVLLNKDSMGIQLSRNIIDIFIKDKYIREAYFRQVNSKDGLAYYLRQVFLPSIFATKWYGKMTSSEAGLLVDFNTKLLGVPRVRQHRVRPKSCGVFHYTFAEHDVAELNLPCHSEFSKSVMDVASYSTSWNPPQDVPKGSFEARTSGIWKYRTPSQSRSGSIYGHAKTYPGGGYVTNLGRNIQNSLLVLNYLLKTDWIDQRTRALFFEVYFYNANQNLFCLLTLVFEITAAGHYVNSYRLRVSKFLFLYDELAYATFICFLMLMGMIFAFSFRKYQQLKVNFIHFFKKIWNIIDVIIIFNAFGFILGYFTRDIVVSKLVQELEGSAHNKFVSFNNALFWDDAVTILATLLVAISTVRLWKLLRFLKMFKICELTLMLSAKFLFGIAFIALTLVFAYCVFAYVIFGPYSNNFNTVSESFLTLIVHCCGFEVDLDYKIFHKIIWGVGYLFYVFYLLILIFVINIFVTIILVGYESAKHYYDESELQKIFSYSIKEFLIDEYRITFSKDKGRVFHTHLPAGGGDMIVDDHYIELRKDIHRKEVRISRPRMLKLHQIVQGIIFIQYERRIFKRRPAISDYTDFVAAVTGQLIDDEYEIYRNKEDDDAYIIIQVEEMYKYISKQRIADIHTIVEYLLRKTDEKEQQRLSMSSELEDRTGAVIATMNSKIKKMMKSLNKVTDKVYMNKGTNVTFEDLGLLEIDDEIERKLKKIQKRELKEPISPDISETEIEAEQLDETDEIILRQDSFGLLGDTMKHTPDEFISGHDDKVIRETDEKEIVEGETDYTEKKEDATAEDEEEEEEILPENIVPCEKLCLSKSCQHLIGTGQVIQRKLKKSDLEKDKANAEGKQEEEEEEEEIDIIPENIVPCKKLCLSKSCQHLADTGEVVKRKRKKTLDIAKEGDATEDIEPYENTDLDKDNETEKKDEVIYDKDAESGTNLTASQDNKPSENTDLADEVKDAGSGTNLSASKQQLSKLIIKADSENDNANEVEKEEEKEEVVEVIEGEEEEEKDVPIAENAVPCEKLCLSKSCQHLAVTGKPTKKIIRKISDTDKKEFDTTKAIDEETIEKDEETVGKDALSSTSLKALRERTASLVIDSTVEEKVPQKSKTSIDKGILSKIKRKSARESMSGLAEYDKKYEITLELTGDDKICKNEECLSCPHTVGKRAKDEKMVSKKSKSSVDKGILSKIRRSTSLKRNKSSRNTLPSVENAPLLETDEADQEKEETTTRDEESIVETKKICKNKKCTSQTCTHILDKATTSDIGSTKGKRVSLKEKSSSTIVDEEISAEIPRKLSLKRGKSDMERFATFVDDGKEESSVVETKICEIKECGKCKTNTCSHTTVLGKRVLPKIPRRLSLQESKTNSESFVTSVDDITATDEQEKETTAGKEETTNEDTICKNKECTSKICPHVASVNKIQEIRETVLVEDKLIVDKNTVEDDNICESIESNQEEIEYNIKKIEICIKNECPLKICPRITSVNKIQESKESICIEDEIIVPEIIQTNQEEKEKTIEKEKTCKNIECSSDTCHHKENATRKTSIDKGILVQIKRSTSHESSTTTSSTSEESVTLLKAGEIEKNKSYKIAEEKDEKSIETEESSAVDTTFCEIKKCGKCGTNTCLHTILENTTRASTSAVQYIPRKRRFKEENSGSKTSKTSIDKGILVQIKRSIPLKRSESSTTTSSTSEENVPLLKTGEIEKNKSCESKECTSKCPHKTISDAVEVKKYSSKKYNIPEKQKRARMEEKSVEDKLIVPEIIETNQKEKEKTIEKTEESSAIETKFCEIKKCGKCGTNNCLHTILEKASRASTSGVQYSPGKRSSEEESSISKKSKTSIDKGILVQIKRSSFLKRNKSSTTTSSTSEENVTLLKTDETEKNIICESKECTSKICPRKTISDAAEVKKYSEKYNIPEKQKRAWMEEKSVSTIVDTETAKITREENKTCKDKKCTSMICPHIANVNKDIRTAEQGTSSQIQETKKSILIEAELIMQKIRKSVEKGIPASMPLKYSLKKDISITKSSEEKIQSASLHTDRTSDDFSTSSTVFEHDSRSLRKIETIQEEQETTTEKLKICQASKGISTTCPDNLYSKRPIETTQKATENDIILETDKTVEKLVPILEQSELTGEKENNTLKIDIGRNSREIETTEEEQDTTSEKLKICQDSKWISTTCPGVQNSKKNTETSKWVSLTCPDVQSSKKITETTQRATENDTILETGKTAETPESVLKQSELTEQNETNTLKKDRVSTSSKCESVWSQTCKSRLKLEKTTAEQTKLKKSEGPNQSQQKDSLTKVDECISCSQTYKPCTILDKTIVEQIDLNKGGGTNQTEQKDVKKLEETTTEDDNISEEIMPEKDETVQEDDKIGQEKDETTSKNEMETGKIAEKPEPVLKQSELTEEKENNTLKKDRVPTSSKCESVWSQTCKSCLKSDKTTAEQTKLKKIEGPNQSQQKDSFTNVDECISCSQTYKPYTILDKTTVEQIDLNKDVRTNQTEQKDVKKLEEATTEDDNISEEIMSEKDETVQEDDKSGQEKETTSKNDKCL